LLSLIIINQIFSQYRNVINFHIHSTHSPHHTCLGIVCASTHHNHHCYSGSTQIIFQVSGSLSSSYNRKQYVHSFEESYCTRSPSSLLALFLFSPSKGFKRFAILAICYLLLSCLQSLSLLGSPFFSLLPLFFLLLQLRLFSLLFLSLLFFFLLFMFLLFQHASCFNAG